ncbi:MULTISPECIES: hypothetical protein [Pseudomonas]|jgi:hypothetical protein|uniref:Uncharacterized protein n=2 Tax=Pseudomonas veronii TaxID=76761 RepID=A0A0R3AGL9_PSEVE|nr:MULTISPECIES: hypothetical protein [Pseudomonas]SEB84526.1 hypothetical protein SAMN04490199_2930 [Pseudomonas marginalis]AQY64214.1 hypothetical protein PverR02_03865 [Pseudomonas veronii]KRP68702.1 hypothetical protein TU80_26255 [Pseudomonas veronii]MBI6550884.1 hypothetical protein [Pseudomonas veronii]MBI6651007.1 hypothetical protein [Pseudomonas veronii]
MNYYDGYSNRLLNDAREVKRDLNLAAETNSGSEEDLAFFFDLVAKHRTSEYVFNEHARVKHMLLKSGLDSGQ